MSLLKVVLAAVLVVITSSAYAGPALDFMTVTNSGTSGSYAVGFEFTTTSPTIVDSLGYYDDFRDGFLGDHQVGIFDLQGILLTSATVTTSDPLGTVNHGYWFRWHQITPLLLDGTYVVAATTGDDNYSWFFKADPADFAQNWVVSNNARLDSSTSLILPTTVDTSVYGIFGPNLGSPVPEPSTLVLVALGIAGAALLRRKQIR